jgi:hypothetical protein
MILKIFSPKNSAKKLAFLTQNKAKLCKNLIITLVFEKNANFFAKNCQKSQKIVIITSVPDWAKIRSTGDCLFLGSFLKIAEIAHFFFPRGGFCNCYGKKYVGFYFGRIFHKLIWSPCFRPVCL